MKFIIDNALSPALADGLRRLGHEALHVLELSLDTAADSAIFDRAAQDGSVVISTDTDFGTLLARRNVDRPSVILFRHGISRRPARQLDLLAANLEAITEHLNNGSVVVFESKRVRIRSLPLS